MNCFKIVLWYAQMARLSFVVTSEIKYTEQYCYNKKMKNTSCQFYLITKRQQIYNSIQLHGKGTCISNNISINIIYSLRDLQYKIVMEVLPTNTFLVKY